MYKYLPSTKPNFYFYTLLYANTMEVFNFSNKHANRNILRNTINKWISWTSQSIKSRLFRCKYTVQKRAIIFQKKIKTCCKLSSTPKNRHIYTLEENKTFKEFIIGNCYTLKNCYNFLQLLVLTTQTHNHNFNTNTLESEKHPDISLLKVFM